MPRGKRKIEGVREGQGAQPVTSTWVWDEMQKMQPTTVKLSDILFDPNNPRLDIVRGKQYVSEERWLEQGVQERCLEDIRHEIGIADLMDSIRTSGFSTIDRIVLKPFQDKLVVVEGNRRFAALKTLVREHEKGNITLPQEILAGIQEFEALIYQGSNPDIAWVVQGFRHTPGIKPWERYPTAKFFADLGNKGMSPPDIAKTFGVRPKKSVSQLIRAYHGFQQAKADEDYGDNLNGSKFGLFDEIIFVSDDLKKWVDWDDTQRRFKNEDNLTEFLSWAVPEVEGGKPKIDISPTTRKYLPKLLQQTQYKELLGKFRQGELTLEECRTRIDEEEATIGFDTPGVIARLRRTCSELDGLPVTRIKRLGQTAEEKEQKKEILHLLKTLQDIVKELIRLVGA